MKILRSPLQLRIATFNLRFDSQPDDVTVEESIAGLQDPLSSPKYYANTGEQPWSVRRIKVAQQVLNQAPDIIGFQEALIRQVNDLEKLLGPQWEWVGKGRDDGLESGEYNPIFYNRNKFKKLFHETFWLSNTPFKPSKYPNAGSSRVCEVLRLLSDSDDFKETHIFTIINTHLDDRSDEQRRLGASLLLLRAQYESHKTDEPVFLLGDFNSPSSGMDAGAYQIITGATPPLAVDKEFAEKYQVPGDPHIAMVDLKAKTPRIRVSGNFATYTGFNKPGNASVFTRIDFAFSIDNNRWTANSYKVGSTLSDDGTQASDHRPVFIELTLD